MVSCFDELLELEGRYPRSHLTEDAYVNSSPNSDIDSAVFEIAALREAGFEEEFDKLGRPGSGSYLFFSPIRNAIIEY